VTDDRGCLTRLPAIHSKSGCPRDAIPAAGPPGAEGYNKIVQTFAQIVTPTGVEPAFDLGTYYPIFLYLALVVLFAAGSIVGSAIVGPRKRTAVKLMPYESGMDPVGDARQQIDIRFYLIAILFLVFDVELLFLYPWAVVAYRGGVDADWRAAFGRLVFAEVIVFLVSLAVAYVYAWRKGVFQWR
jgi:NADH-quinone oxidoreductase subunit A